MLKLPRIPYSMEKNKRQVVSMGSINYSKMTNDGDIADSGGVSGRHFPLITTARGKGDIDSSYIPEGHNGGIDAITVFRGEFVYVKNNKLFYGGREIGDILLGEKQFAAVNTRLVIMPDKKYLDVVDGVATLKDLGAVVHCSKAEFNTNFLKLVSHELTWAGGEFTDAGDTVTFTSKKEIYEAFGGNSALYFNGNDRATRLRLFDEQIVTVNGSNLSFITKNVNAALTYQSGITLYALDTKTKQYGVYKIDSVKTENIGAKVSVELTCTCTAGGLPDLGTTTQFYTNRDFEYSFKEGDFVWFDLYSNGNVKERYRGLRVTACAGATLTFESSSLSGIVNGAFTNGGFGGDFREFVRESDNVTFTWGESSVSGTVKGVEKNEISLTKADITSNEVIGSNTLITIDGATGSSVLKVGDVVSIRGCSIAANNIDFRIDSISEDGTILYAAADIFEPSPSAAAAVDEMGEENGEVETVFEGLTIERRIPTLDYICESDNRLYGCSNEDNTIYVSALGDPTNIYAYQGISTDSYAVAVASEEPFTGCCPYDGGVLFWKENKLHKLLGSYPAEYALYTYNIDGVQEGSHKSLQNIGEVLYYKGVRGVFAFNGSPQLISSNFGDKYFTDAVAGTDGAHYLISMKSEDGGQHFFSFDTGSGLWVREGSDEIKAFTRKGKDVYMLEDGKVYVYGAEETPADAEWFIQFTPIYETIEGQKSYSRIKLRVELPRGSHIILSVRCDGGRWAECGKIVGRVDGVIPVMVPINRCDKFELKIEGKGPCTIHSILREYFVGGDR